MCFISFYIMTTPYLPCNNNNNINRKKLYDFYYTAITLTTGYKQSYKSLSLIIIICVQNKCTQTCQKIICATPWLGNSSPVTCMCVTVQVCVLTIIIIATCIHNNYRTLIREDHMHCVCKHIHIDSFTLIHSH